MACPEAVTHLVFLFSLAAKKREFEKAHNNELQNTEDIDKIVRGAVG